MRNSPAIVNSSTRLAALIGNPNTGKSTLFNALTGYRQRIGNYPGVTVEKRTGTLRDEKGQPLLELIDLPGAYSLSAQAADEAVVLDVLLGHLDGGQRPAVIVVVLDASHLSRNLFLTAQVFELGCPVVVALNMTDLAEAAGMHVDAPALERELGVPVVPVVATRKQGVGALRRAIATALESPPPPMHSVFPECVQKELDALTDSVASQPNGANGAFSRVETLQTLLDPGGYHEGRFVSLLGPAFQRELDDRRQRIESSGESIVEIEARVRYAWIDGVVERCVSTTSTNRRTRSDAMDRILTHRVVGLAALLVMMGACFQSIYAWAAPVMDAIDLGFSSIGSWLTHVLPPGALQSLLVNGAVSGVGAVLVFLPQILILFLFIAILEDCGYMARAAFLLDRWMGLIGLNGKSFIPLLSSFACAVPGIMATRTIENRQDRLVTILVAPLMSCSARLPVYLLLIGAFVPATPLLGGMVNLQAVTLLALYFVGFAVAIPVAWLLKKTILKSELQPFLMELPSYNWPSPKTVLFRVYEQGREFLVSAGTIIFAVTIVVWALGYYPHPGSIAAEYEADRATARATYDGQLEQIAAVTDTGDVTHARQVAREALDDRLSKINHEEPGAYLRHSLLGRMGRWIEPVVKPLGWDWRIGTAAIASFPAREVVLATMGTIYNLGQEQDETSLGLREEFKKATWPDGRPVYNLAVALSIMVFYALCCQCGATLATIKRETNSWRWPLFTFTYMTTLSYVAALATYQITIRFL